MNIWAIVNRAAVSLTPNVRRQNSPFQRSISCSRASMSSILKVNPASGHSPHVRRAHAMPRSGHFSPKVAVVQFLYRLISKKNCKSRPFKVQSLTQGPYKVSGPQISLFLIIKLCLSMSLLSPWFLGNSSSFRCQSFLYEWFQGICNSSDVMSNLRGYALR